MATERLTEIESLYAAQKKKTAQAIIKAEQGLISMQELRDHIDALAAISSLRQYTTTQPPTETPPHFSPPTPPAPVKSRRDLGRNFRPETDIYLTPGKRARAMLEIVRVDPATSKFVHSKQQDIAAAILAPKFQKSPTAISTAGKLVTYTKTHQLYPALLSTSFELGTANLSLVAQKALAQIPPVEHPTNPWAIFYQYLVDHYSNFTIDEFADKVLFRFKSAKSHDAPPATTPDIPIKEEVPSFAPGVDTEFVACGLFMDKPEMISGLVSLIGGIGRLDKAIELATGIKTQTTTLAQPEALTEICHFLTEQFGSERYQMVYIDKLIPDPVTSSPIRLGDHKSIIEYLIATSTKNLRRVKLHPSFQALKLVREIARLTPPESQLELENLLFPPTTVTFRITDPFDYKIDKR